MLKYLQAGEKKNSERKQKKKEQMYVTENDDLHHITRFD